MSCSKCSEKSGPYHDQCRTHSYCSRDFQYFGAPCAVCQDLWARARDIDAVDGAMRAFEALKEWITGFRKNSRHRVKGTDYFFDHNEREAFQDLHALHTNLKIAAKLDDPQVDPPPSGVSFI